MSHATGRRTVLNPRRARLSTNSLVMGGFPQPVSHEVVFSSVLPMLMPGLIAATAPQASSSVIFSGADAAARAPSPPAAVVFDGLSPGGVRQASG